QHQAEQYLKTVIVKVYPLNAMDKLGSYISSAESLANTIGGTSGAGQLDRGNGKIVNWSFKGQRMGFEWKYIGICVDQATGETTTVVKQSRAGSIEHSMRDLFQRLAARNAL
ncbi:uncharacterized protein LOC128183801, partial [Crassostrea angulata]|uniref:uncharacterized protein LOC128183801 n=1 Tax=Magallana angulata TaxID=2784310 RepID=UPI0022B1C8EA